MLPLLLLLLLAALLLGSLLCCFSCRVCCFSYLLGCSTPAAATPGPATSAAVAAAGARATSVRFREDEGHRSSMEEKKKNSLDSDSNSNSGSSRSSGGVTPSAFVAFGTCKGYDTGKEAAAATASAAGSPGRQQLVVAPGTKGEAQQKGSCSNSSRHRNSGVGNSTGSGTRGSSKGRSGSRSVQDQEAELNYEARSTASSGRCFAAASSCGARSVSSGSSEEGVAAGGASSGSSSSSLDAVGGTACNTDMDGAKRCCSSSSQSSGSGTTCNSRSSDTDVPSQSSSNSSSDRGVTCTRSTSSSSCSGTQYKESSSSKESGGESGMGGQQDTKEKMQEEDKQQEHHEKEAAAAAAASKSRVRARAAAALPLMTEQEKALLVDQAVRDICEAEFVAIDLEFTGLFPDDSAAAFRSGPACSIPHCAGCCRSSSSSPVGCSAAAAGGEGEAVRRATSRSGTDMSRSSSCSSSDSTCSNSCCGESRSGDRPGTTGNKNSKNKSLGSNRKPTKLADYFDLCVKGAEHFLAPQLGICAARRTRLPRATTAAADGSATAVSVTTAAAASTAAADDPSASATAPSSAPAASSSAAVEADSGLHSADTHPTAATYSDAAASSASTLPAQGATQQQAVVVVKGQQQEGDQEACYQWVLSPYTFYAFPSEKKQGLVDTTTLRWLLENGFDFNKWVASGFDYARLSDLQQQQLLPHQQEQERHRGASQQQQHQQERQDLLRQQAKRREAVLGFDFRVNKDAHDVPLPGDGIEQQAATNTAAPATATTPPAAATTAKTSPREALAAGNNEEEIASDTSNSSGHKRKREMGAASSSNGGARPSADVSPNLQINANVLLEHRHNSSGSVDFCRDGTATIYSPRVRKHSGSLMCESAGPAAEDAVPAGAAGSAAAAEALAAAAAATRAQSAAGNPFGVGAVGLQRLIETIIEHEKPMVVHNGHLDLLHIFDKFVGVLPRTLPEFCQEMLRLFSGGVYDTKHLANEGKVLVFRMGDGRTTSLPRLRQHLLHSGCPCVFSIAPHRREEFNLSFQQLNLDGATDCDRSHEAGYDAMLTAQAFVMELDLYAQHFTRAEKRANSATACAGSDGKAAAGELDEGLFLSKKARKKRRKQQSKRPSVPVDWQTHRWYAKFKNKVEVAGVRPGHLNLSSPNMYEKAHSTLGDDGQSR